MADEVKPSALDSAIDSVVGGITHVLEPNEKSIWHTVTQKWLSLHYWVDYFGEWYVSRGLFLTVIFVPLFFVAENLLPSFFNLLVSWLLLAFPVIGVVGGITGFYKAWLWYAQSYYIFTRTNPVLLEVHMPHHVEKTPRAMEQVMTSFWIRAGETTFIDRNYYGGVRPYASLEICSFGGEIHFFIWCRKSYRNVIEAAMYSQYPEVEIEEVEDYASKFEYDPAKHHCFVTDYLYANNHQKSATDVYPIKTYHDFEIDEEIEEFSTDPYGSVLEVLSALNSEEQIWIQIVVRGYFKKDWHNEMHHEVEEIRREASKTEVKNPVTGKIEEKLGGFPRPTEIQKEQMHAIERHMGKLPFEVGLRGIYIAPAGKMRSAEYTAMRWIWRPFANPAYMNMLRPRRAHNDFDYLYQDWGQGPDGVRWQLVTRRYFDAFRRRQFFAPPWKWPDMHMSAETIATLWHPPSGQVKAPGLHRIHVGKAEAPSNLPM